MKIQIDLSDILRSEYGDEENLANSIHRQVVEKIKQDVERGIKARIDSEVSATIDSCIKSEIEKMMPEFVSQLMDSEYERRDRYGHRDGVTTFRKEMIKSINEEMVYKPDNRDSYSRNENTFTKAVRSILESEMKRFQAEYNKTVDAEFVKQTVSIVTTELRKKFLL